MFLHLLIALSEEAEVTQYHQVAMVNLENVVFNDCLTEYALRVSTNLMLKLVEFDQFMYVFINSIHFGHYFDVTKMAIIAMRKPGKRTFSATV